MPRPTSVSAKQAFPNLRLLDHPLAAHKLAYLRRKDRDEDKLDGTSTNLFRRLTRELGICLFYEAARELLAEPGRRTDPTETFLVGKKAVIVPILRSGLPMAEGALELMPSARVGHLGFRRIDKVEVEEHLTVLPDPTGRQVFLMDAVIGTGHSAVLAIDILCAAGAKPADIRFCCILAAPEGILYLQERHPGVLVHAVCIEDGLDAQNHVVPGFGDSNKRLFGIK